MYKPNGKDKKLCRSGRGCEYGICDECEVTQGKEKEDKEVEQKQS